MKQAQLLPYFTVHERPDTSQVLRMHTNIIACRLWSLPHATV